LVSKPELEMNEPFYPLASTTWGPEEYEALRIVIASGNFTMGKEVAEYENHFAEYIGAKYAVMTNSGSSANLVMLAAAKYLRNSILRDGDSVIVPAVSWSTTFYPVHQLGLTLSFVDIDIDTLNIDVEQVEAAINEKTRAILVVNLLGNPANLIDLRDIANKYNLILLEDNCESLGASLEEKKAGTFGLAGTYSSFFSHHISTMEGGITTTDDLAMYETMKSLRAHGWTRDLPNENHVFDKTGNHWDDLFRFVLPGYNLRPLELEGALGQTQIKKLDEFVAFRRKNAEYLLNNFHDFKYIKLQNENGKSSWFGFSLILKGNLEGKRPHLIKILDKAEIQSRPVVAGNFTLNPVMKYLRHEALPPLPNATYVHENGLFVGNHHYDLKPQLDRLLNVLTEFEETHD
jgi:CDP-6-deoxy-D-xylo-4-hexulose-3-dehydrase